MGGPGSGRKRSHPPKFKGTNYSIAFREFQQTRVYARAVITLEFRGMKQPYIDNWIRSIFEAGWMATGTKIELIPY